MTQRPEAARDRQLQPSGTKAPDKPRTRWQSRERTHPAPQGTGQHPPSPGRLLVRAAPAGASCNPGLLPRPGWPRLREARRVFPRPPSRSETGRRRSPPRWARPALPRHRFAPRLRGRRTTSVHRGAASPAPARPLRSAPPPRGMESNRRQAESPPCAPPRAAPRPGSPRSQPRRSRAKRPQAHATGATTSAVAPARLARLKVGVIVVTRSSGPERARPPPRRSAGAAVRTPRRRPSTLRAGGTARATR